MAYTKWQDVVPQKGKQELAMNMVGKVDFMLMGGARFGGKSELLSMMPLMFSEDSKFRGIFFRRQYDEIMGANSLWEKAENMYPFFDGSPHLSAKSWSFPSGSKQFYRHMYVETDKDSHRGKGYSLIGFDEIDQFSKEQVTFLMTCLRSEAEMDSFCVGTLNPNPDSWCLPLVEYYLTEEGLPDETKTGHIRHFIVKEGDFVFGDSEQYFIDNYRENVFILMPDGSEMYVRPKRFTYMFFNIFDNPLGLKANPVYLSELNNLPDHERDTQLWGNWYSRPRSQSVWQRHWIRGEGGERVKTYLDIPPDIKWFRGVDKGYSEPSDVYKYPDYTAASPKIGKDRDGNFWILGEYHADFLDNDQLRNTPNQKVYGRVRKLSGARDAILIKQGKYDGNTCTSVLTKDTGGAGTDHTFTMSKMIENGIKVIEDKSSKNTPSKKLLDFLPFCNACSVGLVYIVEDSFNEATLKYWYKELENFDPAKKSSATTKDDWVDSTSLSFNAANNIKVHTVQKLSAINSPTIKKNLNL